MKNQYRLEASIIERYITKDAIEFYTNYLLNVEAKRAPRSRYLGMGVGKGTRSAKVVTLNRAKFHTRTHSK